MDGKRRIRQLTTGMHVFAAMWIAVMVSASAAFAASGMCKPGNGEIDVPLDYGDYYFLEALLRFRALVR